MQLGSIRYVCLSDLHLGEEGSLLTNLRDFDIIDPDKPSPVLVELAKCLKHIIKGINEDGTKPTLILAGDILEIALAEMNDAAMVFERFIEQIMPAGDELFERIIYIPGNHDHHFWEIARESQYIEYIKREKIDPKDYLDKPFHTTSMFIENAENPLCSSFLTMLVQRYDHLKNFCINVAYPNFAILKKDDERKCMVFHHGHFIEKIYQAMTILSEMLFPGRITPKFPWEIEAENFAWIDFFWSTMGRSGKVGAEVEQVYKKMQNQKELEKLLSNLATSIAKDFDIPYIPGDRGETAILKFIFNAIVKKVFGERTQVDEELSSDAQKGLWAYVQGPLYDQIQIERKQDVPSDFTFVFGHTHKPFEEDMRFRGYQGWVNVYNTGGWVVDSEKVKVKHGGSAVLADKDLNVTSLKMYRESADAADYKVEVAESRHIGDQENPFHKQIKDFVNPSEDPWRQFSLVTAREVLIRLKNFQAKVNA